MMSDARVVFAEEFTRGQWVKIIVCGALDETLLNALQSFVDRQRKRLAEPEEASDG